MSGVFFAGDGWQILESQRNHLCNDLIKGDYSLLSAGANGDHNSQLCLYELQPGNCCMYVAGASNV